MSRGYSDTLISLDLTPLRATLGDMNAEIKKQATMLQMLTQASDAAAVRFSTVDRQLAEIRTECEGFRRGLEELKRMDDKIDSWGERLKAIEERHVKTMGAIHEVQVQGEVQTRRVADEVYAIKERLEILQETNPLLRNEVRPM